MAGPAGTAAALHLGVAALVLALATPRPLPPAATTEGVPVELVIADASLVPGGTGAASPAAAPEPPGTIAEVPAAPAQPLSPVGIPTVPPVLPPVSPALPTAPPDPMALASLPAPIPAPPISAPGATVAAAMPPPPAVVPPPPPDSPPAAAGASPDLPLVHPEAAPAAAPTSPAAASEALPLPPPPMPAAPARDGQRMSLAVATASPRGPLPARRPVGIPREASGGSAIPGASASAPNDLPPLIAVPRFRRPPRPPDYPPRAVELDLTGTVVVRALLDPEGDPREIRIHRSSGHAVLDGAAVAAVRGWHFAPASRDGRRIPAWVEVPVHFRLR